MDSIELIFIGAVGGYILDWCYEWFTAHYEIDWIGIAERKLYRHWKRNLIDNPNS